MGNKALLALKLAVLLLVITAIHLIVLYWCTPSEAKKDAMPKSAEMDKAKPEEKEPEAKPAENKQPETKPSETKKPDAPKTVRAPRPPAKGVKPYQFNRTLALPASMNKLAKRARSGIIIDLNSRRVLWMKEPNRQVAIASLTKMMTALLVMEKMDAEPDKLSWNTPITITDVVKNVEPSILGLKPGEVYTAGELMQSMLINSHNDSAAQLAEVVAGSVPAFVEKMNQRAKELQLATAVFNSPNGLPQGKKRLNSGASAADITRIGELLLRYPEVMQVCASTTATLHTGKKVWTHNNLLKKRPVKGMEGFKTGYTNAAGSCLAFSVNRKNRRIIGCVTGCPSAADRDNFTRQLIDWVFKLKL